MLEPSNRFHSVRRDSALIGFCCFGADARVSGGTYDVDALDIGAGMAPALVGNGHGRAFLGAVVEYAAMQLDARKLRATIASWNERARRAALSVGFHPVSEFCSPQGIDFTILVLHRGDGS
jgi:RimJ/RimL family protein N-acetyltransferase